MGGKEKREPRRATLDAADALKLPKGSFFSGGRKDLPPAQSFGRWDWLFAAALVVAVFLVYQPAWQGGLLWDDDAHVTRPELRSWHGLYRIWFDVGATLQYYPLVHSAFWVEHKLWGDATLGYHLVNIFLHATAALMVALILRRLAIPGAYLAAAIFALHPVQVESVAWITELKNTLSAVFYLGAAMLYLRFDQTRKTAWYLAALGLFVLALLSKTVTATLPAALLVIFWWQRGRLSWKKDVLPLVPFFLLGAGMGMLTAWWELKFNQCVGPEFEFTLVERILIAGRAVWFHLGKLFWPANLTFIYPRWQIDSGVWWQYLFPLGAAALLAVMWAIRQRTRAPLAAVLFFGGTLFPVLGFFNLYTFRYSLVADHFQYLASLGIITLFSAGVALLLKRAEGWGRRWTGGLRGAAGRAGRPELAAEPDVRRRRDAVSDDDRQESRLLDGPQQPRLRVWPAADRSTRPSSITGRPWKSSPTTRRPTTTSACALAGRGQVDEAIAHYRKALEIKPDYAEAHNNLGERLGRPRAG